MTSQILFTITTLLLSMDCEALFFNDGHMELADHQRNYEETNSTLPLFLLDRDQVNKLRTLLNKPEVVRVLEQ